MVKLNQGLDLSGKSGDITEFPQLQPGIYVAKVSKGEIGYTKKNNDAMIILDWEILQDPYDGRFVGSNFREWITIEGIGQARGTNRVRAILLAIGAENPNYFNDTDELLDLPCLIEIAMKPETQTDENGIEIVRQRSRIAKYLPIPREEEEPDEEDEPDEPQAPPAAAQPVKTPKPKPESWGKQPQKVAPPSSSNNPPF
jgi:hypothetical protein